MKILLPSLITTLIFVSCVTQKQRAKICASCPTHTTIKDSIRVEIKERLVNVFITDTFTYFLSNPCAKLCDSIGNLKPTFKAEIKSTKGTKINLFVKDNQLHFVDVIDSLKKVISVKDTTIKRLVTTTIEVAARCKLEHINWWDKFWIKMGRFWVIVVLLFGGFKLFKWYSKWHLPI